MFADGLLDAQASFSWAPALRMRRCKALLQRALAGERKLTRRATRQYLSQAEKRLC